MRGKTSAFHVVALAVPLVDSTSNSTSPRLRFEDRDHLVDLVGRDDQRGAKRDPVRVEPAEQSVLERPPANPHAKCFGIRKAGLGRSVAHELDRLEQPLAAYVADHRIFSRHRLEARPQSRALGPGVFQQVALDDLSQHGDAGCAGNRVALERMPFDEAGVLCNRAPEGVGDLRAGRSSPKAARSRRKVPWRRRARRV